MENLRNYPSEAVKKFKEQFPYSTTREIQSFILGYEMAMNDSYNIVKKTFGNNGI